MTNFVCPECKDPNSKIFELNEALVEIPVTVFGDDGEPRDFGEWKVVCESISVVSRDRFARYRCSCGAEFDKPVPES